jgi:hypothetical protein
LIDKKNDFLSKEEKIIRNDACFGCVFVFFVMGVKVRRRGKGRGGK